MFFPFLYRNSVWNGLFFLPFIQCLGNSLHLFITCQLSLLANLDYCTLKVSLSSFFCSDVVSSVLFCASVFFSILSGGGGVAVLLFQPSNLFVPELFQLIF